MLRLDVRSAGVVLVGLAAAITAPPLHAALYQPQSVHDVDLLDNGNLLVTDGGAMSGHAGGGVFEIDRSGNVVWSYTAGLLWAHNADRQPDGSVVISDTDHDRVIIVSAAGTILWDTSAIALSDGSTLNYPNDANVLASGNRLITDRDNHRVIEIDAAGNIVWQFGQTGVAGSGPLRLNGPHNADRLPGGNTVIADSNNRRIIEVTPAGAIAWTYAGGLNWPRDADRLAGGNTLVNDSNNRRIIEVAPGGSVVWQYSVSQLSYDADRLVYGNTLLSAGTQILEVNAAGSIVWSFPAAAAAEVVWITNPATGVALYCHVHRPAGFDPLGSYAGLVLAPGGSGAGTSFDVGGRAQSYADLGFIVMHFDPDGRGLSTNGGAYTGEDYCGYKQQAGLREVLRYLFALPETDNANIGVLTNSYGITLGAGALGRYAQSLPVKFLLDWEGPADRTDTAQPTGHVPHDVSDNAWWYEREPTNFIDDFPGYYLRIQSQVDHVQSDNEHAIKLVNRATAVACGGAGRCAWTRVNSESGLTSNMPNTVYTMLDPPDWLAETVNNESVIRTYLAELAGMARLPASPGDADRDGDVDGSDYGLFADCFNGTGNAIGSGCDAMDIDGDTDVDGADFGLFAACFNGSGNPPACW